MNEAKKWTNLTRAEISLLLAKKDFKVSRNIVRKLFITRKQDSRLLPVFLIKFTKQVKKLQIALKNP
jgi:hypothetical protein